MRICLSDVRTRAASWSLAAKTLREGVDDYLNLPDGTVPAGNSNYTVIAVVNADVLGSLGYLGSGNGGTTVLFGEVTHEPHRLERFDHALERPTG